MKKILLSLFFILCIYEIGISQAVIQGTVNDANTGKTLPGVNVYLAGTTVGTSTDEKGFYKIVTTASGPYDLVFSFVGYKKQLRKIELSSSFSRTIDVKLEEKVVELGEIEVKSSNKKWQKQYETFFKGFIGENEYANEVTIKNPWVLEFEEKQGDLIATAPKPITIINRALGYKIYVELVEFRWPKNWWDLGGYYKLYPKYEPLTPDGQKEEHQWVENRVKSYVGSFPHFLKCLYNNTLERNNFTIKQPWNLSTLTQGKTKYEVRSIPGISPSVRENAKGFRLADKIDIEFEGLVKYSFNGKTQSLSLEKDGGLIPSTNDHLFFVDEYGSLINPISLQVYRSWADNRMANSLPTNYSIGD